MKSNHNKNSPNSIKYLAAMYSAKWIGEGKAIITDSSRGFKHEIIALITLHGGLEAGN